MKFATAINELKNESAKQQHNLLVRICEKFKDYIDFNQPITENSVNEMLERVSQQLDDYENQIGLLRNIEQDQDEIAEILQVERDEIMSAVRDAARKARELTADKARVEADKSDASQLLKHRSPHQERTEPENEGSSGERDFVY